MCSLLHLTSIPLILSAAESSTFNSIKSPWSLTYNSSSLLSLQAACSFCCLHCVPVHSLYKLTDHSTPYNGRLFTSFFTACLFTFYTPYTDCLLTPLLTFLPAHSTPYTACLLTPLPTLPVCSLHSLHCTSFPSLSTCLL